MLSRDLSQLNTCTVSPYLTQVGKVDKNPCLLVVSGSHSTNKAPNIAARKTVNKGKMINKKKAKNVNFLQSRRISIAMSSVSSDMFLDISSC